jgi:rare lipoprotein A
MLTVFLCDAQELPDDDFHKTDGRASYYAKNFQGRKTANGEMFNNSDFTAAHRTLPFNTYLNVVNKENNYNIIVRVNDRGPYAANRIIDLSEAAARRIGGYHHGLVPVKVEVINYIQLTPELDSLFKAHRVTDCFGNRAILENYNLSVWSSTDLLHVIYIANDLYLKEDVSSVLIVRKKKDGKDHFHVVLTGYKTKAALMKAKDLYERKGFMKVQPFIL